MADTNVPPPILSAHIEETVRSIAQLQADHREKATPLQRSVDRVTAVLGRPGFIVVLTVIVFGWISLNLLAATNGYPFIDSPPFPWLGTAVSLVSLYMVVVILTTQRREDQLGRRRELLILELAILGEQKTAKVIELLEEVRRDNPLIQDRVDQEADVMAQPADAKSVLDVMRRPTLRQCSSTGPQTAPECPPSTLWEQKARPRRCSYQRHDVPPGECLGVTQGVTYD
jgi:uncharacterized membrane protein